MSREEKIARTFVELADTLADDFDVIGFAEQLAFRCRDILDITDAAVLLASPEAPAAPRRQPSPEARPASPETLLYSPAAITCGTLGDDSAKASVLDTARHEGPTADAYRTAAAVTPGHLGSAPALWPDFTLRARAAGYTYAGAVPLRLRQETLGSLLLLRTGHSPMPVADFALAQAFADAAAIGLLHARFMREADALNEQLRAALHSRILIEQAKGYFAARRGISPAEAFEVLRRFARHHRLRLAAVAREVIATGDLPRTPSADRNPGRGTPIT
ncbi:ANTAR domain-containing protein [Streptomyces sp. NPDC059900]|uniref:ANTAR domain-containing protein n=1 Tax=Streptomyces sp. NPDC059900 TaxID=3155816 RepID=UPI0034359F66